jgi:hypothetical protein
VLDFQSSGIRHDFWLLAVHRPVAFSRPCLVPVTPHPLSISANRHPTVPAPPEIDGFVLQTYALYFAQPKLLGLRPLGVCVRLETGQS